jgi:ribosome recycling factor
VDRVIAEARERMQKAVETVEREFATVRTGRATPALLDKVMAEAYGTQMPVNQLATISVPEPRLIVVTPWDKQNVRPIEKAIITSKLGLTPNVDGQIIRIPIPTLTEERRKELAKQVRELCEEGKVAIRNIRRDAIDRIKKMEQEEHLSEDEVAIGEEELQELTRKATQDMDDATEAKVHEIMEL